MSAQYRPYRDEESVEGLEATWSDNEPGSVQIYEKTTEELPFNSASKRFIWTQVALLSTVGILGFILGYFTPYHPAMSINAPQTGQMYSNSFDSYFVQEDETIKDKLLSRISGDNILALLKDYQNTNRIPGSEYDQKLSKEIERNFKSFDLDHVSILENNFKIMIPKKTSVIKLLDRDNQTLYSNVKNEKYLHDDVRPFLPLSQGNETTVTTNQLVYVNRGRKEDFTFLSENGFKEATDKVFVVRLGFYQAHEIIIRAQELGASAVLLFPDPEVYGAGSPFPDSAQLPRDAEKSHPTAWSNYGDLIANFSVFGGIDLSKFGLERESKVQIPIIPISFNTAQVILRGLKGRTAPVDWNCFDFTLYIGPGYKDDSTNEDKRDRIQIEFYNQETSIVSTTVTGVIRGSAEPDRYVIIGSRRDSLSRGLLDSISGTSIMLELARVFGGLLKEGWRPRRTIMFNSFGSETFNLLGSSTWLDFHQRQLHQRAVAYVNCDLVVTGNQSISVAASPLMFQTLFNATKQVKDPNGVSRSIYQSWLETTQHAPESNENRGRPNDADMEKFLDDLETDHRSPPLNSTNNPVNDDQLGNPGSVLHDYRKSAAVKTRPRVRLLDLQSIYSPFFLYAGIPVIDVRFAGHPHSALKRSNLLEDTHPFLGTKYDNLASVRRMDPNMKYHVAVAEIIAEITRDLSDSVFLPFNLFHYAMSLKDSYNHFIEQHGKVFNAKLPLELDPLKQAIQDFSKAAAEFHHRQDRINPRDSLGVRRLNDQLMSVERAFLDPTGTVNYNERKHIIFPLNEGNGNFTAFPGLVDFLTTLDHVELSEEDVSILHDMLKLNFKLVVQTISNAVQVIDEVYTLPGGIESEKKAGSQGAASSKSTLKERKIRLD